MIAGRQRERVRKARHGEGGGKLTILLHYLPGGRACEREGRAEETEEEICWRMLWGSKKSVMCQRSR